MITNQVLNNVIEGLCKITDADFLVLDVHGEPVASTEADLKVKPAELKDFIDAPADTEMIGQLQLFKIFDESQLEYVLVVSGSGSSGDNTVVGKLAAFQLQNLLRAYKERFDKENFIKNLLLDNLLLVDIYNRAKRLRIPSDARRIVFILECSPGNERGTPEEIRRLLGDYENDFVTAVDEKSIIIVKELGEREDYADAEKIADTLLNLVGRDFDTEAHIAYGTIVNELKEVSRSYKEARMALDVGKIFFDGRDNIAYSSLGIGRLIYQLPIPLCKMFIREIFAEKSPDDFDEDTLTTINKFFENNLNVSETSRQLYIHRNTLVYRLDKLQKSTGLDLRIFEDAITFKIALMVVKYMKYMETLEY